MLAYEGICRPGEPLKALRKDLLLPVDLVVEGVDVCYLRIVSPKGKEAWYWCYSTFKTARAGCGGVFVPPS